MSDTQDFTLSLTQEVDYAFRIEFDGTAIPALHTDESPPLGGGRGPNPPRLLAAGVANCLAASLLFALRKFRNTPGTLKAKVRARLARNAGSRWRIDGLDVDLQLADPAASTKMLERALAQFEDFCIVTESVRKGIAVNVNVRNAENSVLHTST